MRYSTFAALREDLFQHYRAAMGVVQIHEADCGAADDLAEMFREAGYTANVRGEADAEGLTLVVFTNCPTVLVHAFLEHRGAACSTVDYLSSDEMDTATYAVKLHGCSVSLVASSLRKQKVAA